MKTLPKIVSTFTKTIKKLQTLQEKNTAEANSLKQYQAELKADETMLRQEADAAYLIQSRIEALFDGVEINP